MYKNIRILTPNLYKYIQGWWKFLQFIMPTYGTQLKYLQTPDLKIPMIVDQSQSLQIFILILCLYKVFIQASMKQNMNRNVHLRLNALDPKLDIIAVSTVCFQMSPQVVSPRGCIITLVAFICLFSTVHFQMCPEIACLR